MKHIFHSSEIQRKICPSLASSSQDFTILNDLAFFLSPLILSIHFKSQRKFPTPDSEHEPLSRIPSILEPFSSTAAMSRSSTVNSHLTACLSRPRAPASNRTNFQVPHTDTAKSGSNGPCAIVSGNLDKGHCKEFSSSCLCKSCLNKSTMFTVFEVNQSFLWRLLRGRLFIR